MRYCSSPPMQELVERGDATSFGRSRPRPTSGSSGGTHSKAGLKLFFQSYKEVRSLQLRSHTPTHHDQPAVHARLALYRRDLRSSVPSITILGLDLPHEQRDLEAFIKYPAQRLSSPTTPLHVTFIPLMLISAWPSSSSCPCPALVLPTCRHVLVFCARARARARVLVCSPVCLCCC